MTQANIDPEEWLEVWRSTSVLENQVVALRTENRILEDWVKRLEYRIQKLEESLNGND